MDIKKPNYDYYRVIVGDGQSNPIKLYFYGCEKGYDVQWGWLSLSRGFSQSLDDAIATACDSISRLGRRNLNVMEVQPCSEQEVMEAAPSKDG